MQVSVCVCVCVSVSLSLFSPTSVARRPRMPCTTSCPSCTPSTRTWRPAWLPWKAAWMRWAPPCRPCLASSPKPYTHFPRPYLPSLAPQTRQPRAPHAGGHPWPPQTAGDGPAHHRTPQSWPLCGRHLHTIQAGRSHCASWRTGARADWAVWPGARPTQTVRTGVAAACFLPDWSLGSPGRPPVPWPLTLPRPPVGSEQQGEGSLPVLNKAGPSQLLRVVRSWGTLIVTIWEVDTWPGSPEWIRGLR